jgi:hypothetical protein
MKIKSIFDGWTSRKQCFGPLIDDGGRYCAMGWGYARQRDMGAKDPTKAWHATCQRIAPLLKERFPELSKKKAETCCSCVTPEEKAVHVVVYANDFLHVPAEVFLSLDREAQETARLAKERRKQETIAKKTMKKYGNALAELAK